MSGRFDRQSFLGADSEELLAGLRVAIVGYGGGGSHFGQQLAHIGVGEILVFDDDIVEETNLNRLVGGVSADVAAITPKVTVADRVISGVNPAARVRQFGCKWSEAAEELAGAHVVLGAVDSFAERLNLERFCRRFLLPYIDIGMDVIQRSEGYEIVGQVILSSPEHQCLRCMGLINDAVLEKEERARQYGDAGSKPQVIWPNGVLASTAVGLLIQLITPWQPLPAAAVHLEYNGNTSTLQPAPRLAYMLEHGHGCSHYPRDEVGDALFGAPLF
ncbi:ThiF family adenylyltransferase [Phenylobacterium sp.]|jgi:molybdopterin/thiamine biosynthesis adenylyltransferase|uniref:HesA/MoeB/ThiF family protein n=1 Tax=Phenylobacterium sp. TaxID=1871053 RepID=UPI0025DAAFD1|nr:ThiF family adenylyltransferase [Phenylobacterium sp.]